MDRVKDTMFLASVLHLKAQGLASRSNSAHNHTFAGGTFGGIIPARGIPSLRTSTHQSGALQPCFFSVTL